LTRSPVEVVQQKPQDDELHDPFSNCLDRVHGWGNDAAMEKCSRHSDAVADMRDREAARFILHDEYLKRLRE
jgi:hypothetical protein